MCGSLFQQVQHVWFSQTLPLCKKLDHSCQNTQTKRLQHLQGAGTSHLTFAASIKSHKGTELMQHISQMSEVVQRRPCHKTVSKAFQKQPSFTKIKKINKKKHVSSPNSPEIRVAAGRGSAQTAGLLVASNQAAARDLSSITGGAAEWSSPHSHLLSAVHL